VSARGLQPLEVRIPLGVGLQQKNDPRSLPLPGLTICKDVQFDEIGGLQTRHPYQEIGTGQLSNVRQVVGNDAEKIALTKTGLHSWSSTLGTWVSKGTHLAVKIEEAARFTSPGDQVDADRAELDGIAWYTWVESGCAYVAAVDVETDTVAMSPVTFGAGNDRAPRLVALATKVLWIIQQSGQLYVAVLDPAAPSATPSFGTILTSGIGSTAKYDVCQVAATDTAVIAVKRTVTTDYSIGTITAGGVVTMTTKARDCTGAIAVSVEPTGTQVQVIRANGTNVQGDLITISGFVDVYTNQAIGTTPTNAAQVIAACHRSVQNSGVYRCYAFWSSDETSAGGSDWYSSSNWVSTGNTLGTAAVFKRRWAPRARAFDRSGEIYVWGAFFGASEFDPFGSHVALQSTYFLLRDDGFLAAKAVMNSAGAGAGGSANDGNGWIPGCQDLGSGRYAFAAVSCRVIKAGADSTDFASRAPRDVVFTFDSNEARRTARLGETLYIACGEGLLQYDGAALTEVGYHQQPWYIIGAETTGGSIATNGTYAYKFSWRSANAKGEVERSSSSIVGAVDIAAQPGGVSLQGGEPLYLTHRTSVAWEIWRTAVNPTDDAPFYLVTSKDPSVTSNPNRFVFNDPTAGSLATVNDEMSDAVATTKESHPENGLVLDSIAPPPCTIVVANADRLFLAGIAGDPHRIWYSMQRGDGEVARFNDALTCAVPREGGEITGLAFLNETLIVFKETAIYALAGDGFDNTQGGQNFGPARMLASDVGAVSHEAIGLTPAGLVFKSNKGWYLLNRGWSTNYIGAPVADYDSDTVVAVHVLETQHQVRCLTTSRCLVFDYLVTTEASPYGQWSEWTISNGAHAALCSGTYNYATADGVFAERSDFVGLDYGFDIQTAPVNLTNIQGYGRVWSIEVLGEYQGPTGIRARISKNNSATYFQDKTWPAGGTWPPDHYSVPDVGDALEIEIRPSLQEMRAISVRLTATGLTVDEATTWSPTKLTSIALEVGVERHLNRLPTSVRQ
jgi:hypothetical protein